jgi:hypothetical protein
MMKSQNREFAISEKSFEILKTMMMIMIVHVFI